MVKTNDSDDSTLVSYVLATYNRADDLAEAVESILDQTYRPIEIVVVSNSTDVAAERELFEEGGPFDRECVQYHHFAERMGAPGAKNACLRRASGDVIVQIDDDAVVRDPETTNEILSLFRAHEDVGILAFQSRNYYTGQVKLGETPDPPDFGMSTETAYRTTNFVGVGVAFRGEALESAGLYPDDFIYGFEEMDLSLRVHDAGYDVLYAPSLVVYHKKTPEGRIPDIETKERLVENRINIALLNLPWRYVVFTSLIYSVYLLLLTRRLMSIPRMFRRIYEKRTRLLAERSVVDSRTIDRIKSRKTMLFLWWYGPHPSRIVGRHGNLRRLLWEARPE